MTRRFRLAVVSLVLALTLANGASLPLIELPVKPAAPALRLPDLEGNTHDIEDYRGKVVVVNFWATWCAPCRREFPALRAAWAGLRDDGVVMLAVNLGDRREKIERFLKRHPVDFPVLLDPSGGLYRTWQLQGLPTTYVVDRRGSIHFGAIGERDWRAPAILRRIRSLL